MKKQEIFINAKCSLLFGIIIMASGCTQMSEKETDISAGLNGGFEVSRNGLPVNWLMYTSNTVPDSDFKVVLDRDVYKEGEQSLKYEVNRCASTGGWHSPGFTNEFFEAGKYEGEGRYKLSLWIRNSGSKFRISAGGVAPYKGEMKTLIENDEQINSWRQLEYEIEVTEKRHLRMELNILEPGTFWIDDVRIERVKTAPKTDS